MSSNLPANTKENEALSQQLEQLRKTFLDLYTTHNYMVDNHSAVLTSLYLQKLGHLQLELLKQQAEAARLKLKMKLIQAAINRDENPDLQAIEDQVQAQMETWYAKIREQAAAIDQANQILSHLLPEEDAKKLKEIFRLLCKRLHPDLNPNQSEKEKDLFIKVKAAYDLKLLHELQKILLYLDNTDEEKPPPADIDEKRTQIKQLEENIRILEDKINQLKQSFPFNIEHLIYDDEYIAHRKDEISQQIEACKAEIIEYSNIISIMTDE